MLIVTRSARWFPSKQQVWSGPAPRHSSVPTALFSHQPSRRKCVWGAGFWYEQEKARHISSEVINANAELPQNIFMARPEEWRRVHKVDVSSMQKKCRSAPASQKARANCMAKNKIKIAWKPQTEALEGSQSSRNAISSYSTGACTLWSLPEESRCGPLNLTTTEDRCFRQQAQGHSERRSSVPEDGSRQERNFETGWHLRAAATKFGTAFNLAWNTTAWRRDCGCRCCSWWRTPLMLMHILTSTIWTVTQMAPLQSMLLAHKLNNHQTRLFSSQSRDSGWLYTTLRNSTLVRSLPWGTIIRRQRSSTWKRLMAGKTAFVG